VTRFLAGFAVGIGLGIIFAPARGSQTRAQLREKAEEVADLPRKKAAQMANIGKEKAGELGARIGRQSAEAAAEAIKQNVLGNDKSA
jgi:gas vesicle protein